MNNKEIIYLLLNLQFSPFSGTLFIYVYKFINQNDYLIIRNNSYFLKKYKISLLKNIINITDNYKIFSIK